MNWPYWITLYVRRYCVARGLRPLTLAAYESTLQQFCRWMRVRHPDAGPESVAARDVLEYLQHLRQERGNGDSAVNRTVTILRRFYQAMVAMGYLEHSDNPMAGFPTIKSVPRKLPVSLSPEQVTNLLSQPDLETQIGMRDHALLWLLYGTGIRASECATLRVGQVDLVRLTITVLGKGGHERAIPLNPNLAEVLRAYERARGPALPTAPFFRSRSGRAMSRAAVYERVRTWGQRSRVGVPLSPHRMRHTFATHLVRAGVGLVIIRDLLGHRQITSTQIYLHVTAEDLRSAALKHPIGKLLGSIEHLLPTGRLPFQRPRLFAASG